MVSSTLFAKRINGRPDGKFPFDFWPNVVMQAVLAGWLVILTLRVHGFGRSLASVLVAVLALAALTCLTGEGRSVENAMGARW